jgi:hypothetical protein
MMPAEGKPAVRIVCPSCAVTNRLPDQWAGRTFVCRKCSTLVTAPEIPGVRVRSWATSGGWLAIVGAELVLAAVVAAVVVLSLAKPPAGLPLVPGLADGRVQLAAPGKSVVLEWPTGLESAGGHFRVAFHNVRLFDSHDRALVFGIRIADDPWPSGFLEQGEPPPAKPVTLHVEIDLPAVEGLAGTAVRLSGPTAIDYVEAGKEGSPPRVQRKSVPHESPLVVATPEQEAAFERYAARRAITRWAIFGSVMAFLFVGVAACALAQKRVMVICPKCGRATESIYYYEAGEAYISPCPHTSRRRQ